MADQKNAAWLHYLRSFLKQGARNDQKRGSGEGLNNTETASGGYSLNGGGSCHTGVMMSFSTDANDTPSPSRKRMRRSGC
eukprot:jgi/Psemu1/313588/fgenesh1_kg.1238_\